MVNAVNQQIIGENLVSNISIRPWNRLPMPHPKDFDPSIDLDEPEPDFFYNNFVKHFISDTIQMMDTGLNIDQDAVEELRSTVDQVLKSVEENLKTNPLVQAFQTSRLPTAQKEYADKCTQSVRTLDHYIKPFKDTDVIHRTWVVNTYLNKIGKSADVKDKWTLKHLKTLNIFLKDNFISALCEKRRLTDNTNVKEGMVELAKYKLDLWNRPRWEASKKPVTLDPFNPGSNKQVKEFFEFMGVPPKAFSKDTGEASWGRDQLEELFKETTDKDLLGVLQPMLDYSSSSIIKTNFIKAFDKFTIDGVLHGNVKLFGCKSFRPSSNSPNLLNSPSTGSIYAKPLKKCFIAPDGYVIYAVDYNAVEDRVIANLSGDKNKIGVFTGGLDGHSLAAVFYRPEEAKLIIGDFTDKIEASVKLKKLVDEGNKVAMEFRQNSKAISFGLAYGKYPDESSGGAITQEIFDNYHNELYPGITAYREKYVLPTAKKQGYIHLGLGCRLHTSSPSDHIRTLHNATCQFWSILTLIAVNELNYQVEKNNLSDDIKVHSTIYDSIYIYVRKNAEIIKWLNDTLVPIMNVDYMTEAKVPNECVGELGTSWASLDRLENNASIENIKLLLANL